MGPRSGSRRSGPDSASIVGELAATVVSALACSRCRARVERLAAALLRFGRLEDVEVELTADEGRESVTTYRAQWAGQNGGRWAEWSQAVEQLRREERSQLAHNPE